MADDELDDLDDRAQQLTSQQCDDDEEANNQAADDVDVAIKSVTRKAAKSKSYKKVDGVYLGSQLCALPRCVMQLSQLTQRQVLLFDVLEDRCEAHLKPHKAAEARSNHRHHRGILGYVVDVLLGRTEMESSLQGSHCWNGEGMREIRFGECWLKREAVGGHNIVEAIALAAESTLPLLDFVRTFHTPSTSSLVNLSVLVGCPDGAIVSLCACGRREHKDEIDGARQFFSLAAQFRSGVHISMDMLRKHLQTPLPPAPTSSMDEVIEKAIQSAERAQRKRDAAAANAFVGSLLVQLGDLAPGAKITQAALNQFAKRQRFRHQWPAKKDDRIAYLYTHRDKQWNAKQEPPK